VSFAIFCEISCVFWFVTPERNPPMKYFRFAHIPSINPPRVGANAGDFTDAAGRKGELPGTSIEGGDAFHLKKGDVSIVPKGTPINIPKSVDPLIILS